jgi:hypothetical protein
MRLPRPLPALCWLVLVAFAAVAVACGSGSISGDDDDDAAARDAPASDGSTSGDAGASADAGATVDGDFQPALPVCVWNQAYQENYDADSVGDILANAQGCYVLIDPFESTAARNAIPQLNLANNIVGCYISSGTCEDWRDDFAAMQPHCVSEEWGEWGGEYFVDMPNPELVAIMQARIDNMSAWGCDMVEFDNMDWVFDDQYRQQYGFTATEADGIAYNQALCDYTHGKGMGCMAKNTRQGAEDFDGGTFESYNDDLNWWVTAHLQGFLNQDQLGIIVHYDETDCDGTYDDYKVTYGAKLSFICEDRSSQQYTHYN